MLRASNRIERLLGAPWRSLSAPAVLLKERLERESQVSAVLRGVTDPAVLGRDLSSLGYVKHLSVEGDWVEVHLSFPYSIHPGKRELLNAVRTGVRALPWFGSGSSLKLLEVPPPYYANSGVTGLARVRSMVAVTSGKGGVGKSTVAYHLARALASLGARVGLFDCDLYGPSLGVLAGVTPRIESPFPTMVRGGVHLQSPAFYAAAEQPMALRGSIAVQRIRMLLDHSDWGDLDFLLLDFPPGTGDIPLSLSQSYRFAGSLIVSTPQALSLSDVRRGIQLLSQLHVPLLGVVENLAYFECEHHSRYFLFGESHITKLREEYDFSLLFSVPILPPLSSSSCERIQENAAIESVFRPMAESLLSHLIRRPHEPVAPTRSLLLREGGKLTLRSVSSQEATASEVPLASLRTLSLHASVRTESAVPVKDRGASVYWSDGSEDYFPYPALSSLLSP